MNNPTKICLLLLVLLTNIFEGHAHGGRLMVPGYFTCEPNYVTSWTGRVSKYQRTPNSVSLEIATDANTVENIRIEYSNTDDLLSQFYFNNRPFNMPDWSEIESSEGMLVDKMRVTVWLCESKNIKPLINWQPKQN
ncbi:MAG: hypothetical protein HRT38_06805 [Alteromonadaceae bacterium]|nr:hypothetical protein [Alteromonadaceae bacterium]